MDEMQAVKNPYRTIWRRKGNDPLDAGDHYQPSIEAHENGTGLCVNVGGTGICCTVEDIFNALRECSDRKFFGEEAQHEKE